MVMKLCVLFVMFAGFASCRDSTGPERTRLDAISELKAYSRDSTSIGLAWTASPSVNTSYMAHQRLIVLSGQTVVRDSALASNETAAVVQNLVEGTIYQLEVSVKANSTSPYRDSFPVSIDWSPAKRFFIDAGSGQPLRLYESDSPGNLHALRCYLDSLGGPRLLSLASAERAAMDFYLLSSGPALTLRTGSIYSQMPVGRQTRFSEALPLDAATLDHPQSFVAAAETYLLDEVNVPSGTILTGKIFFARTEDQHYLRILVVKGVNNSLVQGTSPNRYIDLALSYQSTPGIRFANTGTGSSTSFWLLAWSSFRLPLFTRSLR